MDARPGPAFDPDKWTRGFSREQIIAHFREVIDIVEELDPPADLREQTFQLVQVMVNALEPVDTGIVAPSKNGVSLVPVGGG